MAIDTAQLQILLKTKGIKLTKSELKGLEAQTKSASASFGKLAGAMAGAVAAGAAFKSLVDVGKEFQFQMAKVAAVSGELIGSKGFKALEAQARELGGTTANTAAEIGGLQENLARLGFPTEEILGMTEAIQSLAYATVTDLAQTAEMVGTTMNAFSLSAEEAAHTSDVFASATANSALNMTRLNDAMTYVSSVAGGLGYTLEDTTSMLGILADKSINGSMAGTALRKVMLDLSNESSKLSKYIGFPVRNMEDLQKAVLMLKEEGFDPMVEGAELVGPRVAAAFGILFDGASDIEVLTEKLEGSSEAWDGMGEAAHQSDIMLNTLTGRMAELNSAVADLQIQVFKDMEESLMEAAKNMTLFIQSLDTATLKKWATEFVIFLAAWKGLPIAIRAVNLGMKLFRGEIRRTQIAMAKTPWGIFAVGISIAAGSLMEYFGVFDEGNESLKTNNDELERQKQLLEGVNTQTVTEIKFMKQGHELSKKEYEQAIKDRDITKDKIDAKEKEIRQYDSLEKENNNHIKSLKNILETNNDYIIMSAKRVEGDENFQDSLTLVRQAMKDNDLTLKEATDFIDLFIDKRNEQAESNIKYAKNQNDVNLLTQDAANDVKELRQLQEKLNTTFAMSAEGKQGLIDIDNKYKNTQKGLLDGLEGQLEKYDELLKEYEDYIDSGKLTIEQTANFGHELRNLDIAIGDSIKAMKEKNAKEAENTLVMMAYLGVLEKKEGQDRTATAAEYEAILASVERGDSLEQQIEVFLNLGNASEVAAKKQIYYDHETTESLKAKEVALKATADQTIKNAVEEGKLTEVTEEHKKAIETFLQTIDPENLDTDIAIQFLVDEKTMVENIEAFNKIMDLGVKQEYAIKAVVEHDVNLTQEQIKLMQDYINKGIDPTIALQTVIGDPDQTEAQMQKVIEDIDKFDKSVKIALVWTDKDGNIQSEPQYWTEDQRKKAEENWNEFVDQEHTGAIGRITKQKEAFALEHAGLLVHEENKKKMKQHFSKLYVGAIGSELKAYADSISGIGALMVEGNDLDKKQKIKMMKMMVAMAYGQAIAGGMRAFASAPWPSNIPAMLSAVAQGYTQVKNMENQLKALQSGGSGSGGGGGGGGGDGTGDEDDNNGHGAEGGYISGPSHSAGGVQYELEGGEYVIRKSAVDKYGSAFFEKLNTEGFAGVGMDQKYNNKLFNTMRYQQGGYVFTPFGAFGKSQKSGNTIYNINISAPLLDDTVADEIIPRIQDAIRRGESFNEEDLIFGSRSDKN